MAYLLVLKSRRLWLALAIVLASLLAGTPLRSQASSPCGANINAIVCENLKPGDPASSWDVTGSGDASIQGFSTDISADQGGLVQFKVKTDAAAYHIDIYRVGYYSGMGARKVATIVPSVTLPQTQPACLTNAATGLIDCGNWAISASWSVPPDAVSGVYLARLVRNDTGGASHVPFVVRDDDGHSDLLFQTSDTTWQAYNNYGGNSLYVGQPDGRAYKVSYNRPLINRSTPNGGIEGSFFATEMPMVRWLEANGYNVSYFSGVDTERRGAELLEHKVFLSVGHDEYWSAGQRANVEAARDAGINLAFFSGNESFWKTRWESSIDASATAYRTLVSYKETHANAKIDPTATWTGTWRDPRFSPPADGGRPENSMSGTMFMVNGTRNDPLKVPAAQGLHRFWRNTSVATLAPGTTATFANGLVGYEIDEAPDNATTPPGLQRLSTTTMDVSPLYLQDYGSTYGSGIATHSLTLYRAASGALVFGAGTVQYSWGLDATHDRSGPAADPRLQQATVNLLADMGAQPGSLQLGLVTASPSLDTITPGSTISSPPDGGSVQSGTPVTITGTASDSGGGIVTSVDVSTDNGATWHHASGTASWTYSWTPSGPGSTDTSATIRSRAYDDSGNLETPGSGIRVTVRAIGGLVASYGFNEGSGTLVTDVSANGNTGTITGATWTQGRTGMGGALLFNGSSNWVTINDVAALHLTNGMTLEAWVNPSSLTGWRSVIMKEAPPNTLAYSIYANDSVPRPATTIRVPNGDLEAAGTSGIPLNQWTHLAGSYDGTTVRLYVNGTQVAQTTTTGNLVSSTAPLRIGGNAIWGEYFSGAIDEVRVYRRALAPSEIQADVNTPVGGGPIPDTTPPTVSITAPSAGATVGGTATTVSANAGDNVAVVGVQFLLDGASLGAEDTTSPYSISWNTTGVTDGTHVLSARARDAAGNTALATNVSVTVNNTPDSAPPTVSITTPASGATLTGTTTVTVNASDNVAVAGVTFLVDNVQTGAEDTVAPFSWSWNTASVPNGSHTLTARARDGAGNTATSAAVTVTVTNTAPPPIGLVAAYSFDEGTGSTVGDSSGQGNVGTISGATWTTAGKYGKALTFNGSSNWVTVADANSLDLTTGMTLEAWVNPTAVSGYQEAVLKEATGDLAYALYANNGTPAMPAGVMSIGTAQRTAPGTSAIAVNVWTHIATTFDGATLRMFVNGVQTGTASLSGSINVTTGALRIGGNAIWGEYFSGRIDEVRVYNRALTAAEIAADMNAAVGGGAPDTTPPTVALTAPASGATVGGTITVSASASDNVGVAGVQFLLDGASLGAEDTSDPYSISWNTVGATNGTHTLSARARDAAGNTTVPASVTVTVNNTPDTVLPSVAITAPASGATLSGTATVTVNASDNVAVAGVTFLVDNVQVGAENTVAPYSWSWNTTTASNGTHSLTARARDNAGNTATSAAVSVTVSNTAPPPMGLVAAYSFDEGAGSTVGDSSGSGNVGTISGATWTVAGKYGKALTFNGTSNWVTVPDANSLDLTTAMTIEAWVNPTAVSGYQEAVLKEATGDLAYALYANNGTPAVPGGVMSSGAAQRTAPGTSAIAVNVWTHIATTFDGVTLRMFVNGVQTGTASLSGSINVTTGPLRIGGNTIWGEYFSGSIDDVRIYNRALTAAEIAADMNTPVP